MKFIDGELGFTEVRSNIMSNGPSILKAVINWYLDGSLDHPEKAKKLISILACICEGKMKATTSDDGMVDFSLTSEYEDYIHKWDSIFKDLEQESVIRGPWV
ncbi:MAG: hypothetical protein HOJ16_07675 [Candidatus Peribacter sp.]|jgi:hypothetical protein|nr:hypothetical protein [Candidatus Peribacter sp.]